MKSARQITTLAFFIQANSRIKIKINIFSKPNIIVANKNVDEQNFYELIELTRHLNENNNSFKLF